ncbi:hypothetical protein EON67_09765, partial [archaeon]
MSSARSNNTCPPAPLWLLAAAAAHTATMTDHADTMTTLWSELSRNLAAVEEVNKALLAQAKDGATDQKAREERLTRAVKTLEEQKKSHIDLYKTRSAAGAVSPEEEEAFWKTLSSQEDMIEAAQAKVD